MEQYPKIHLYLGVGLLILAAGAVFWFNTVATSQVRPSGLLDPASASKSGVVQSASPYLSISESKPPLAVTSSETQSQTTSVSSTTPSTSPPVDKETILDNLVKYSTSYEATSLPLITPYLSSEDPEIRDAAVNAIVVVGDAAGAPILRKAAATVKDPHVAAEMLDKADYLELPSATLASRQTPKATSSEAPPASP